MKFGAKQWLCIALILVLVGSIVGAVAHTSGGAVKVQSVSFVTEDGIVLHALLYTPKTATNTAPAPAIVASHGYNNTAEVQDMNAIELSRRGYVVLAIDAYAHGESGINSENMDHNGIVPDMGGYAALQYVSRLPFVDKDNIGMVGHSLGCAVIQGAALRAFKTQEGGSDVAVPKALLLTSNAFATNADVTELTYAKYPVNVADLFGQYDEWAENMWITVKKGSEINVTPKAIAGMGFSGAKFGSYYNFGVDTELTREQAIEAANARTLRVLYQPAVDHPRVHFSVAAEKFVLDYFDITLKAGKETLAVGNQTWYWKEIGTGVAMAGFFIFLVAFGLTLLKVPYFATIVQPEPVAPTVVTDKKSKLTYWGIYLACLLPAPLLFFWFVGYPIDILNMGRTVPQLLVANNYFQMPAINGVVLMNVVVGLLMLGVFTLTYKLIMQKNGVTFANLGVKVSGQTLLKSLMLAVITFLAGYMLLVLADYFFMTDFRFWVFSVKTISAMKFGILLKYLPFYAFFFIVTALTLNSFTRIRGEKEWKNILLMIGASIGGLAVFTLLDYACLKITGIKMFPYIPYPANTTSALAGLFVWNLLFILPIAAVITRIFFKKTGSIWVGAFMNSLMVTLFAISNTVIAQGMF